ncbi:MAG: winged helix-turn-helix domain-containing protein, partial [Bacteroidaceae bacterium]|nr:winged helix-turn-helix domain-containing protein [Bacteroidaceae bacterium]
MHVEKADVGKYLMKSEIFRMNYLNLISAKVSRLESALQFRKQGTPLQKVIDFILANFTADEGEKLLTIKMNDLAEYLDETRLTVSNALNQLEASHVVSLRRKEVRIPDISSLKKYRNEHFS